MASDEISLEEHNCKFLNEYEPTHVSPLEYLLNGTYTTGIMIIGLTFNIASIVVLRLEISVAFLYSFPVGHQIRTNALRRTAEVQNYLIALEVWNCLLLIGAFFLYGLPTVLFGSRVQSGQYVLAYPYSYFVSNVSLTGTVWMVLALTVDRYRCITKPFHTRVLKEVSSRIGRGEGGCENKSVRHRSPLSIIHPLCIVIMISVLSILVGLPFYFEVVSFDCSRFNETYQPIIAQSSFRENTVYKALYRVAGGFAFQSAVPISIVIILLWSIICELRKAKAIRQNLSARISNRPSAVSQSRPSTSNICRSSVVLSGNVKIAVKRKKTQRANKDNAMLLCVIFKLLISRLFPLMVDITELIFMGNANFDRFYSDLINFSNALVATNSATDFFLYITVGHRFRQTFQSIFLTCLPGWILCCCKSVFKSEDSPLIADGSNNHAEHQQKERAFHHHSSTSFTTVVLMDNNGNSRQKLSNNNVGNNNEPPGPEPGSKFRKKKSQYYQSITGSTAARTIVLSTSLSLSKLDDCKSTDSNREQLHYRKTAEIDGKSVTLSQNSLPHVD